MKVVAILLCFTLMSVFQGHAFAASPQSAAESYTEFHDPFEEPGGGGVAVPDPLEPVNRGAFWANDKIYTYLLHPLCESVPEHVRNRLASGLEWLLTPVRVGEMKLDFRFRDAGSEVGRFFFRSLMTAIEPLHPEAVAAVSGGREDFDQAFERMGFDHGFYLILPVFGPSTLRDGVARLASLYIESPLCLRKGGEPPPKKDSLGAEMKTYAAIRQSSLDPYLFIRDAYQQQRVARSNNTLARHASSQWQHGAEGNTGVASL